jgi:AraC family transcriptional regulator
MFSSDEVRWSSLLVYGFESAPNVAPFPTPVTRDQIVTLAASGQGEIVCKVDGRWRRKPFRAGIGNMISGGQSCRMGWQSAANSPIRTILMIIPTQFFLDAKDEYRPLGTHVAEVPLRLGDADPVIASLLLSLQNAIASGAPNVYAETLGQYLATHILMRQSQIPASAGDRRRAGVITDRRLQRVLAFMHAHCTEDLSLLRLSREACVSPFHFVKLFKKQTGTTPHQFLMKLRMEAAAQMLTQTGQPVAEISRACSYQSLPHFCAAFQRHFAQSPAAYRRTAGV